MRDMASTMPSSHPSSTMIASRVTMMVRMVRAAMNESTRDPVKRRTEPKASTHERITSCLNCSFIMSSEMACTHVLDVWCPSAAEAGASVFKISRKASNVAMCGLMITLAASLGMFVATRMRDQSTLWVPGSRPMSLKCPPSTNHLDCTKRRSVEFQYSLGTGSLCSGTPGTTWFARNVCSASGQHLTAAAPSLLRTTDARCTRASWHAS
mmetsp:Transcript_20063/g.46883  ORF Transcript_20063/g.46883 Transcript_20063/m.46883 type:complete len:210 (+) Transcript_20063:1063-1692(+)